jgi:hypothetical protein
VDCKTIQQSETGIEKKVFANEVTKMHTLKSKESFAIYNGRTARKTTEVRSGRQAGTQTAPFEYKLPLFAASSGIPHCPIRQDGIKRTAASCFHFQNQILQTQAKIQLNKTEIPYQS